MLPDDTTGSIHRPPPESFTVADWRVAEPALRQALKSGVADDVADWSNPATGASGAFKAAGEWFDRGGRNCRGFDFRTSAGPAQTRAHAVGCLDKAGNAIVSDQKASAGA